MTMWTYQKPKKWVRVAGVWVDPSAVVAVRDASDAINAYLSNDYRSMDTYTSNINTAADDVQSVLIDYDLASAECVGGSNG